MDPLEEPPVPGGGQRDVVVVRQPDRPVAGDDTNRAVFLDDDHQRAVSGSVVIVGAGERRIRVGDLLERLPELVGKITGRDPAQDLAALVTQAGVASAAAEPSFLEELICDRHAHQATHLRTVAGQVWRAEGWVRACTSVSLSMLTLV